MSRLQLRRFTVFATVLLTVACGGSNSPAPTAPGPVDGGSGGSANSAWTMNGTVLTTLGGTPVAEASVKPDFGEAVRTDAQGRFRLAGATPPGPVKFNLQITAPGHVEREVWVAWRRGTWSMTFDMVADSAPFSLAFYRQMARNAHEETDLESLVVLRAPPSFYVRTVDEDGRRLEASIVNTITGTIRTAVREFTGGRFEAAAVETGTAERRERRGWINVNVLRETEDGVCGSAFIGADPGGITLLYGGCGCGDGRISSDIVAHEVGHALGFFHVADRRSVMYGFARGRCPGVSLTEADRHHAAVAYTRPRGNRDPDRDPDTIEPARLRTLILN